MARPTLPSCASSDGAGSGNSCVSGGDWCNWCYCGGSGGSQSLDSFVSASAGQVGTVRLQLAALGRLAAACTHGKALVTIGELPSRHRKCQPVCGAAITRCKRKRMNAVVTRPVAASPCGQPHRRCQRLLQAFQSLGAAARRHRIRVFAAFAGHPGSPHAFLTPPACSSKRDTAEPCAWRALLLLL